MAEGGKKFGSGGKFGWPPSQDKILEKCSMDDSMTLLDENLAKGGQCRGPHHFSRRCSIQNPSIYHKGTIHTSKFSATLSRTYSHHNGQNCRSTQL